MSFKEHLKKIPGIMAMRSYQIAFSAPLYDIIKSRKDIKKYKGAYYGRRCFIVGNGPSLTPEDLDLIKGEISFAANTIYKIFPMTEWRPTFYCLQDLTVMKEMSKDEWDKMTEECMGTFVRMYNSRLIKNNNWEEKNLIYVPIVGKLSGDNVPPFSDRPDKYVYDGSMVTYLSLQIAVYMGFKDIYLIGMDHNFPFKKTKDGKIEINDKSIPVHFWESAEENSDEERIDMHSNYHDIAENAYREAEKYSRTSGKFRIYNATRGGKLEVFERVNLDNVINGVKA